MQYICMSVPIISPGDPIRRNNKFMKEWVENDSVHKSQRKRSVYTVFMRYVRDIALHPAAGNLRRQWYRKRRAFHGSDVSLREHIVERNAMGKIRCGIVPARSRHFQIYVLAYIGNGRQRLDVHRFHIGGIILFPFIDLSSIRPRKPTEYTNAASASPQKNLWNNKMQT